MTPKVIVTVEFQTSEHAGLFIDQVTTASAVLVGFGRSEFENGHEVPAKVTGWKYDVEVT